MGWEYYDDGHGGYDKEWVDPYAGEDPPDEYDECEGCPGCTMLYVPALWPASGYSDVVPF